ncbi:hypothetical protein GY45DRAFT_36494 [Cubamyces sp. BRFM 1775]|nr:hypothetical protein GY45DRAFT_36494 [Cubamyces sp. BRFM 1775]
MPYVRISGSPRLDGWHRGKIPVSSSVIQVYPPSPPVEVESLSSPLYRNTTHLSPLRECGISSDHRRTTKSAIIGASVQLVLQSSFEMKTLRTIHIVLPPSIGGPVARDLGVSTRAVETIPSLIAPTNLMQCSPAVFTWEGGTPPFVLVRLP